MKQTLVMIAKTKPEQAMSARRVDRKADQKILGEGVAYRLAINGETQAVFLTPRPE
ncbi:MAG TPA: hypothetical protein VFI43_05485 [Nitrosospira sp.]|nr:hypothetical protein [Nitrosospira sp.]